MTGDKMLFLNWYYLGVKAFSSHAYQTGSRYLLRVLLEISAEPHCPVPFVWKSPLPPPRMGCYSIVGDRLAFYLLTHAN